MLNEKDIEPFKDMTGQEDDFYQANYALQKGGRQTLYNPYDEKRAAKFQEKDRINSVAYGSDPDLGSKINQKKAQMNVIKNELLDDLDKLNLPKAAGPGENTF
jgi:hypothetical protein